MNDITKALDISRQVTGTIVEIQKQLSEIVELIQEYNKLIAELAGVEDEDKS